MKGGKCIMKKHSYKFPLNLQLFGEGGNPQEKTIEGKVTALEETVKSLSSANEELKASVEGLKADNVKLKEENTSLKEAYKEHFTKVAEAEAQTEEGLKKEVVSIFEAIVKAE